jgi:hypothetical protein
METATRGYRLKRRYVRTDPFPHVGYVSNSSANTNLNIWPNVGGYITVKEPVLWKRWELWLRACPLWYKAP